MRSRLCLFIAILVSSAARAAESTPEVAQVAKLTQLLVEVVGRTRASTRFADDLARRLHVRVLSEPSLARARNVFSRSNPLDAHVDKLVADVIAGLNALEHPHVRDIPAARAVALTHVLDLIARAYLAAGANAGEPRPIARRVDLATGVAITSGTAALGYGLTTDAMLAVAGGGALILSSIVANVVAKTLGLTTRRASGDEAVRFRVADETVERFWRVLAANAPETYLRQLEPNDFAREFLADLNRIGEGLVVECEQLLTMGTAA